MNIYIKNHKEIKNVCNGQNSEHREVDIGVALDMYDNRYHLEHDCMARAEYIEKFNPESLSYEDKKLLHPEQYV